MVRGWGGEREGRESVWEKERERDRERERKSGVHPQIDY